MLHKAADSLLGVRKGHHNMASGLWAKEQIEQWSKWSEYAGSTGRGRQRRALESAKTLRFPFILLVCLPEAV
ncbi:hypothetical protein B0H10DRAFT_2102107 [Mycena sp. CBHHK59/15]|nr:hypothetical protein B0H10DRAFT_2102107 [Mycena sp. CBHHK59/15]